MIDYGGSEAATEPQLEPLAAESAAALVEALRGSSN